MFSFLAERFEPDNPPKELFHCKLCNQPLLESMGATRLLVISGRGRQRIETPVVLVMRQSDMRSTEAARRQCLAAADGEHQSVVVTR